MIKKSLPRRGKAPPFQLLVKNLGQKCRGVRLVDLTLRMRLKPAGRLR